MLSNVILSIVGIRNVLIINLMLTVYIAVGDPTVRKRIANHHVTVNYFCLFFTAVDHAENFRDIGRHLQGRGWPWNIVPCTLISFCLCYSFWYQSRNRMVGL